MTAVIRPADARLKASIMISSSMIESFTGRLGGLDEEDVLLAHVLEHAHEDVLVAELEDLDVAHGACGGSAQMRRASARFALPV